MTYLRNSWYMAAWADEVQASGLARTLLDEPVFLYRDGGGVVRALFGGPVAARDRTSRVGL